jgi:hypothetical protein
MALDAVQSEVGGQEDKRVLTLTRVLSGILECHTARSQLVSRHTATVEASFRVLTLAI